MIRELELDCCCCRAHVWQRHQSKLVLKMT